MARGRKGMVVVTSGEEQSDRLRNFMLSLNVDSLTESKK